MLTKVKMMTLQQEKGESKKDFLEKIEMITANGYIEISSKCYDPVNKLAEVTVIKDDNNIEKIVIPPEEDRYENEEYDYLN